MEQNPAISQRALSGSMGISLGKVTIRFLRRKIAEYEKLQMEIEQLRQETMEK